MSDTVWTAIIGGVAGLIAGSIGSLVAPWVNWTIEQRKQKLALRRELIAKWRAMIIRMVSNYSYRDTPFTRILERQPEYLSLKPHLTKEALSNLRKENKEPDNNAVVEIIDINAMDRFASILSDEVTRIEREWDLV